MLRRLVSHLTVTVVWAPRFAAGQFWNGLGGLSCYKRLKYFRLL